MKGLVKGLRWQKKMLLGFRLMMDRRVPLWMKAIAPAAALAYVVMPIDLIPDFILGVGELDDLGVVLAVPIIAAAVISRLAPKEIVAELGGEQKVAAQAVRQNDAEAIEVSYKIVD